MSGFFITLEGGEGSGKTTQCKRLVEWLEREGYDVVTCRDPGTSTGGLAIRELLVRGEGDRWLPMSEVLLFNAARYDVVNRVVKPSLEKGAVVIYDRFCDSTYVYQGYGRGMPLEDLLTIQELVVGDCMPDLTLVFDVDAETALSRSKGGSLGEDRFENIGREFHTRIQKGYHDLVKQNPQRCVLVNAMQPYDDVTRDMIAAVESRLTQKQEVGVA
ncbi:MAG: dTMP kinase [Bdellovibrionales bacterium]